jgi:predicted membrane-bound mannosyltransferase
VNLAGHDEHYLHAMWTVVSVLGILVAIGLAVVYRRARRRAETDEIEAILAKEEAEDRRSSHVSQRHG